MVKITRVYTRKGDQGKTGGAKKTSVSKNSLQVEVLGLLDELNSFLGWIIVLLDVEPYIQVKEKISKVQNTLFDLGAYVCQSPKMKDTNHYFSHAVLMLENDIDKMNQDLPTLNSFILPGGSEISARIHIARSVCRRTECKLVSLSNEMLLKDVLPYINRLSDWLFVLARFMQALANKPEEFWIPVWETGNSETQS